ncbi:acyl transferase/acyl hydrolase/lysophospholipase [Flagelloscypha sp. PMI_526]|nr:acyl transferase/acyl hydrolase/lysophospholipase [Flagelloscypha sp. PMI_526]
MGSATSSSDGGLRLLSFDGCGIHCISQALIIQDTLRRIEHKHNLPSPPRVCDYFDMISGYGFGGLLAIMCGVLHMTGDQLVEELIVILKTVFSENLDVDSRTARYEEALMNMVEKYSEKGRDARMIADSDGRCKTFVCATSLHNLASPRQFRNYQSGGNPSPDCLIWQAARATTALYDIFNPIVVGQALIGEPCSGGGLPWINPTDELIREASDGFDAGRHITCIVNIGLGRPEHLPMLNGAADFFRLMVSDSERLNERLEERFLGSPDVYRRVNVQRSVQGLDRFDIVTVEQVVSDMRAFLLLTQTVVNLDSLADDLVQRPLRFPVGTFYGVPAPAS